MRSFPTWFGGCTRTKTCIQIKYPRVQNYEPNSWIQASFWPRRFRVIKTVKGKIILQISVISIISCLLNFPERHCLLTGIQPWSLRVPTIGMIGPHRISELKRVFTEHLLQ